jgi:hypothetical protein
VSTIFATSRVGFVTLAVAGLFAQLVIAQRFKPSARRLMHTGAAMMVAAFALFVIGNVFGPMLGTSLYEPHTARRSRSTARS